MYVTACLAGQHEDVEVGEDCRTLPALKAAIVKALPQLCPEHFDVSVGGRALDDEGVASLDESTRLDVTPTKRGLSVLALREAGCEVTAEELHQAASDGDEERCTLFLDAGFPVDSTEAEGYTLLHNACLGGHVEVATLLLDRGSTVIDAVSDAGDTALHLACDWAQLDVATLLLDRGCTMIDQKDSRNTTCLHYACRNGDLEMATLLLDRGSNAINKKCHGFTPLLNALRSMRIGLVTFLLDRGCSLSGGDVAAYKADNYRCPAILDLLERRHAEKRVKRRIKKHK